MVKNKPSSIEEKRKLLAELLRNKGAKKYFRPLSFAQQRMWFIHQLDQESDSYNVPSIWRFRGELDIEILEKCFREIVMRHDVLRTTFPSVKGQPIQSIEPATDYALEILDFDQEHEALNWIREEAKRPFDLVQGPLFRTILGRLGPEDHLLLVNMHHIVSDGWSMSILFQELRELYEAYIKGGSSPLSKLPIQYGDFALWQRERFQGDALEKQLQYWKNKLDGVPILELPTDHRRPAIQTFRGKSQRFELSPSLTEALRALSQQEGATLYMTLLSAFKVLLHRYTQQEDIPVGTPIANRNREEIEGLIGSFVNTLVLRTDLSGTPSFRELLRQVKKEALEAYAHQDLPFEKLVEELQPERDQSHSPLFQVLFAMQNMPEESIALPGVEMEPVRMDWDTTLFDLSLTMEEKGNRLIGELEYNTDLFEDETIRRMVGHLQVLLEGIAGSPDQEIGVLPILTQEERHQLLIEWNETEKEYPQERCVHELFAGHAAKNPDAIAVVSGESSLTYGELNQRANQLAHYLCSQGVGPGSAVGLCVERSLDMMVGLLGIFKSGGCYVPLDPTYPDERLAVISEDAELALILTKKEYLSKVSTEAQVLCLDGEWLEMARGYSKENPATHVKPDDLAYMIYTSGSTGKPKGVLLPHQGLLNLVFWYHDRCQVTAADRATQVARMGFDASMLEIWPFLSAGASLYIVEQDLLMAPFELQDWLVSKGITKCFLPPAIAEELLYLEWPKETALSILLTGSDRLQLQPPPSLPFEYVNLYGPTEYTVICTSGSVSPKGEENIAPHIGQALPNTELYVLDQNLNPVPIGVPGELHIGGDGLARGYLNRPELTAEKFIPHPFKEGKLLYKTGDLVRYLPDGNLDFLGRIDFQVKIRGFRIELGEVEATLTGHPGLQAAAAAVREDGAGDKRLVAYVVPKQGGAFQASEIRKYVKEKLPEYMVPALWVEMDALPLSSNGKVDHKALPAPDWTREGSEKEYVAPRTPVEEMLAEIWSDVLGIDRVGIHDNFFDLGGHSLLATQVVSRIRNSFQVEFPLPLLFQTPVISELAREIQRSIGAPSDYQVISASSQKEEEPLSLSFAQQRMWFFHQLHPDNASYNIPLLWRLQGSLNVEVLEQCFHEIIKRHEVLRTTFPSVKGHPVQVIHPVNKFTLPVVEVAGEQAALEWVQAKANGPFDLTEGPLFRIALLRLDSEDHLLLVNMHHIVSDGWSMDVLIQELSKLYEGYIQGQDSSLPELPIQYKDFALWQREWLQGETLDAQLDYWKVQLDSVPTLQLPTDHPRPTVQTFRGKAQSFRLSPSLTKALRDLSSQEGATLYMTLLSAFKVLLHRYTQQEDIPVGTPIANRNREEIEGLIGFFVNTLVLRTDLSEEPSFRKLLGQVKKRALEAYAHQDIPFEKLVEELQPERDLSYSPLFQVFFTMQNMLDDHVQLADVEMTPFEMDWDTSLFDLSLIMEEGEEIAGDFVYNADLFEEATIERMATHLQILLEGIVADPDQKIGQLPILSEAERHQLLVEWNKTEKEYPRDRCVHELFEEQAAQNPDAVAVVFGEESLTYGELNQRANQLAYYLCSQGVRQGNNVGLCVERSVDMLVGMLGILKAGGAYVPLDPDYPKERLHYMMKDADIQILLIQEKLLSRVPKGQIPVFCLDTEEEVLTRMDGKNPTGIATAGSSAYVIYTSGTTGQPKGVVVKHRGIVRLVRENPYTSIGEQDVFLQGASVSFDAATFEIWGSLLNGAKLVLAPQQPDLSDWEQLIRDHGVTVLWVTAGLFNLIMDQRPEALKGVQQLLVGGEALSVPHVRKALQLLDGVELINGYGPTENTTFTCCHPITVEDLQRVSIPIGRPIANTEVYVLDRNLNPVPIGVPGELYVGGEGLAQGYLNRPDLTKEKFIPHPFKEEERLYKTGDLVRYLPNGNLDFLGRIDNQVKIRGFRIELDEVATVVTDYPHVQTAVVTLRADAQSRKRLVAYVVPKKGETILEEQMRKYVEQKMPGYMIPSAWVVMDKLPLTPNGKVDHQKLPAPEWASESLEKGYVAPRTAVEKVLAEIWTDVLGVENIGIHDNFFERGGDSILSIQIVYRVNERGYSLKTQQIFSHPTIAELAQVVKASTGNQAEQGTVTGELPLTPIQQWFFEQNQPDPHHWNQSILLQSTRKLDLDILNQAMKKIEEHHDALRLRFTLEEGTWVQRNGGLDQKSPLLIVDLSETAESQKLQATKEALDGAQSSLNLLEGPLWRGVCIKRGGNHPDLLFLVVHHLAVDSVSWRILLEDLETVYEQLERGASVQLPLKTTSYQEWAHKLLRYAEDGLSKEIKNYWLQVLGKMSEETVALPVDRPEGGNTAKSVVKVEHSLNSTETKKLLEEVPSLLRTQMDEVLLTALVESFSHWTGKNELWVHLEGHGREEIIEEVNLTRTVGWFTSIYPVHLESSGLKDISHTLRKVKKTLNEIPNKGVDYGILRYLKGEAKPDQNIEPRVSFNYLGQFHSSKYDSLFQEIEEVHSDDWSSQTKRSHLIDVVGWISDGRLHMNWMYSGEQYDESTIQRIADHFMVSLQALIGYAETATTIQYAPEDFPDANLSEDDLRDVMAELMGSDS